uniref:Ataxin-2 C-terminal domain-containing protein n=1 Tax=Glossina pallidipes TaxID=7398 RepID=A0A1A9Z847_GLOPL
MIMKVPSSDWSDQFFEQYVVEEESDNDLDDEQDFSEYLWMENEEEFDKIELQRLEEEELMKECIDAMLEDELETQLCEWQKARNDELKSLTTKTQNPFQLMPYTPEKLFGHDGPSPWIVVANELK